MPARRRMIDVDETAEARREAAEAAKRERRRAQAEGRAERTHRLLARWKTRAKLARTKVRKLTIRARYYDRVLKALP